MSETLGFEVREFTIWRVVCHIPGCPWSQRHDDPEAARRDGANHAAQWHGLSKKEPHFDAACPAGGPHTWVEVERRS